MTDQSMQRVDLDGGVAVGVDGSTASCHALSAAAEEAARRQSKLNVVRAWSMRTAPRPADFPVGAVPSLEEYKQAVLEDTEEIIARKIGAESSVPRQVHVVHSPPPQALLSASRGAELLVVGHRGRGGFAGLMLGSVAEQCVRHAACPVLVIRPDI